MINSTQNPNPHFPVYFARSPYFFQEGGLGSPDTYRQATIKKIDEDLLVLNQDYPLISANGGVKGFNYNLSDILANNPVFNQVLPLYLPENGISRHAYYARQLTVITIGADKNPYISDPLVFINAKVPSWYLKEEWNFYKSNYDAFQTCLTNRNHGILTDMYCPQYIYYLNTLEDTPTELNLKVLIRRKNGDTETVTLATIEQLSPYDLISGNVTLSKLPTPETIEYYQAYFTQSDNARVNTAQTYIVDRINPERVTYLMFRNLYGLFETLRCTGETAINYEYEHQNFDASNILIDYATQGNEVYTFNTGEISASELRFLNFELMTSPEVYLLTEAGNILLSKKTKSSMIYDPSKPTDTAVFEFRKAKTDIY